MAAEEVIRRRGRQRYRSDIVRVSSRTVGTERAGRDTRRSHEEVGGGRSAGGSRKDIQTAVSVEAEKAYKSIYRRQRRARQGGKGV